MSVRWFLIIGALAGSIAGELTKGHRFDLIGNIVVGGIDAIVGG